MRLSAITVRNRSRLIAACALILCLVTGLLLSGCEPQDEQPPVTIGTTRTNTTAPAGEEATAAETDDQGEEVIMTEVDPALGATSLVRIKMNIGDVLIRTYDERKPITAGNFLSLVEDGFYDGIIFHRIEPGFVVQGGDPDGKGSGGPGWNIPRELDPELEHERGTLSMARRNDPDTAGSQFFICLGRELCQHLDGGYAIFGEVVGGMDVVDEIRIGQAMKEVVIEERSDHADEAIALAKASHIACAHGHHHH
jgi:cyclophilin family peptidyl-prolyl cis-trans isomerase